MRRRTMAAGGAVAVAAGVAGWMVAGDDAAAQGILRPDNSQVTAEGAAVYAEACAACHGADLAGAADWQNPLATGRMPAPPHDETGHTWHHNDLQLFLLTKFGVAEMVGGGYESDMPGFEGTLSDREILAVLSWIKSRWPDAVRARHDEINAASLPPPDG